MLVGLYRGLHCPFCRRHIATISKLTPALNAKGIESLAVGNTPVDERVSISGIIQCGAARGVRSLANFTSRLWVTELHITEDDTAWPQKVSMTDVKAMRLNVPDEMPEPMDPFATLEYLNQKDGYEIAEADRQVIATGVGQLVGQFLLDRNGIVRWTFSEVFDGGLGVAPNSDEMMSAVSEIGQ